MNFVLFILGTDKKQYDVFLEKKREDLLTRKALQSKDCTSIA